MVSQMSDRGHLQMTREIAFPDLLTRHKKTNQANLKLIPFKMHTSFHKSHPEEASRSLSPPLQT